MTRAHAVADQSNSLTGKMWNVSSLQKVKFHSGYELDENDYHDVSALCERFGMALPAEYEIFTRESEER